LFEHLIAATTPGYRPKPIGAERSVQLAVASLSHQGVVLNLICIVVALSGVELQQFLVALFLLGVGWNFLFTGSTTLSLSAYTPEEKDRAQGALNFFVFATLALSSFSSGVLVTTQGWALLNYGSLLPVLLTAGALVWLGLRSGRPATA